MVGFLAMGGYAVYVWPAYGLSVAVLAWLAISSVAGLRADRRRLADLEQAHPRRRGPRSAADPTEHAGDS
ncbi:MAG: heme exporter protein CcmD [Proteobacteria bacterium]|nr:heme exporter protein CcmD [Pseudomonadota bacterium]MDA1132756.1 heme exporter protein CcmD [Pseudomonadota bacterium]